MAGDTVRGVLLDPRSGRPKGPVTIRLAPSLRGVPDWRLNELARDGRLAFDGGYLVPTVGGGSPDIGVGVTDQASGAGVADVRGRQRTVGGVTNAVEQYVIAISPRVDTGVYHVHSGTLSVVLAAHATTSPLPGFAFLLNRSAAQMVALRRIEFIEYPSSTPAHTLAPRVTFERPDAGGATAETRKFHLDLTWEEYTLP
jgi:hypothetical protein